MTEPSSRADRSKVNERIYRGIICPHCKVDFAQIPVERILTNMAGLCKAHLAKCPAYKGVPCEEDTSPNVAKRQKTTHDAEQVTIYKLTYLPENRAVYTGRTKDPERRLVQHGSASCKCRLVRDAMRHYGRSKFKIEPIMRCNASDADANESHYIMANKTMYPEGYNLRHGSKAGCVGDGDMLVAEFASGIYETGDVADVISAEIECLSAKIECLYDLAEICKDEECTGTDELCKQLLRKVHPDKAGDTVYSATEVTAMLNKVRESVKN